MLDPVVCGCSGASSNHARAVIVTERFLLADCAISCVQVTLALLCAASIIMQREIQHTICSYGSSQYRGGTAFCCLLMVLSMLGGWERPPQCESARFHPFAHVLCPHEPPSPL